MKVYGMMLLLGLGCSSSALAGFVDGAGFLWVGDDNAIFEQYAALDPEGMFDTRVIEVEGTAFLQQALVDLLELNNVLSRLADVTEGLMHARSEAEDALFTWQHAYLLERLRASVRALRFYQEEDLLGDALLNTFLRGSFGIAAWEALCDASGAPSILDINRLRYRLECALSEFRGTHFLNRIAEGRAQEAIQLALSHESPSVAAEYYRLASFLYQSLDRGRDNGLPVPFADQIAHWTEQALRNFDDTYHAPVWLGEALNMPSYVDFNEAVIITEIATEGRERRLFVRINVNNHSEEMLIQFAEMCIQRANEGMAAGNYWIAHVYFLCALYLKNPDDALLSYIESIGSDENNAALAELLNRIASGGLSLSTDGRELLLNACAVLRANALVSRLPFDDRLFGVLAVYLQQADLSIQQNILSRLVSPLHPSIEMDPVLRSAYASILIAMLKKNVLPISERVDLRQQAIEVIHIYLNQHFIHPRTKGEGPFVGRATMLYIPRLIGQFAEAGFLKPVQVQQCLEMLRSMLGVQGFRRKYKETFGEEQVYLTIADALDALGEIIVSYFEEMKPDMIVPNMFLIYGYIASNNEYGTPAVNASHAALRRIGLATYGRIAALYDTYCQQNRLKRSWKADWEGIILKKGLITLEEVQLLEKGDFMAP